jgi:ribosomal protein L22
MAISPALKAINVRINKIGNGERSFKEEMAALSRELLPYVMETGDIDAVNRLLECLNPKNREIAKKFYSKMLPWTWNNSDKKFGGKSKNKDMVTKRSAAIKTFIADEKNDIWSWTAKANEPTERPARPKNYADKVASLVESALTDNKETERLDPKTVFIQSVKAMVHAGMKLSEIFETFEAAIKEAETEMKATATISADRNTKLEETPVANRQAA